MCVLRFGGVARELNELAAKGDEGRRVAQAEAAEAQRGVVRLETALAAAQQLSQVPSFVEGLGFRV